MHKAKSHPRGMFVTGTDTGVGKTVVVSALTATLCANNIDAAPFKPVATGAMERKGELLSIDARFLKTVSEAPEPLDLICPLLYRLPAAPSVAARAENRPVDLPLIHRSFQTLLSRHRVVIVEGVGGWLTPLGPHFTVRELARELGLPVLVVTRDALGAINHTLLTVESVRSAGLPVAGVIMVRSSAQPPDPTLDCVREIQELSGVPALGTLPFVTGLSVEEDRPGDLVRTFREHVRIDSLISLLKDS